ncbi:zinc finger MYND domain-containing protein 11 [Uranotaenia lowii]|uniref:zinc finger MYND domain-containing protein 11 n=1 Tax=Uranotaenia lowii TaxID=190385 RepID=UPI0024795312|nr:zinc finger MYND domain-containing protein 11 [Uranotaenia lowii]
MERYQRKTPLDVLRSMWVVIRSAPFEEIEHTRLVRQLQKLYVHAADQIEVYVSNAVVDGLIRIVERPKKPKPKAVYIYGLPDISNFSFPNDHPDFYCYECHQEGNVIKCLGCHRVFHRSCTKSTAAKQEEMEGFITKYKRVNISAFGLPENSLRDRESAISPPIEERPGPSQSFPVMPRPRIEHIESMNENSNVNFSIKSEGSSLHVKQEGVKEETSDEPQFVGIIRPPDRRMEERLNTPTIKPEENSSSMMDNDELVHTYCYPCRLVRGNQFNTPPNLGKEEMNYLLKFVVNEYKSWLPEDTYSPTRLFNHRPHVAEIVDNLELSKKLLIRSPLTVEIIRQKVEEVKYETLEQFSSDVLDVAHNVAIIHGANSLEFNAVMYFVTDCLYDLHEIRQCPDCFRHSNEKAEADWFARPCVTRHELVFAKQKGYQYWPAKVIRVQNKKYDVRFFGDRHTRAVIDASNVKPIDSDFQSLKINPKQRGFHKAMEELHKHQALITLPKDYYAYGSHNVTPAELIQPGSCYKPVYSPPVVATKSKGKKRRMKGRRTTKAKKPKNDDPPSFAKSDTVENTPESTNSDVVLLNGSSMNSTLDRSCAEDKSDNVALTRDDQSIQRSPRIKSQLKKQYSDDVVKLKYLMDKMSDVEKIKQLAVDALQEDINRWQQKIRTLIAEYNSRITEVKHKQWCKSCEHEAILHCCWNTSYCSRDCQEKDWPDHKRSHKYSKKST